MSLTLVKPTKASIDWDAFSDCVLATRWGSMKELQKTMNLSRGTAFRIWHGKPVSLIPFLQICRAMEIDPNCFLNEPKIQS